MIVWSSHRSLLLFHECAFDPAGLGALVLSLVAGLRRSRSRPKPEGQGRVHVLAKCLALGSPLHQSVALPSCTWWAIKTTFNVCRLMASGWVTTRFRRRKPTAFPRSLAQVPNGDRTTLTGRGSGVERSNQLGFPDPNSGTMRTPVALSKTL